MARILPFEKPKPDSVRHPYSGFERIPGHISRFELLNYFGFSEEDKQLISRARGAENKIQLALLLGGARLTGRFIHDFSLVPSKVLHHVCDQLGLEKLPSPLRPSHQRTRHHHTEYIRGYLGLTPFNAKTKMWIEQYVEQEVENGTPAHQLLEQVEIRLREQKVVLPGVTILTKLIAQSRSRAEERLYQKIHRQLGKETRQALADLLIVPKGQPATPFQQLKRAPGRPSSKVLHRELRNLEQVRQLLPASLDLSHLPPSLLEQFSKITNHSTNQALKRYPEAKRYALLLCWLWQLRVELTDTVLTIGNDLIAGVIRRSRNAFEKEYKRNRKRLVQVAHWYQDLVHILLDTAIPDAEVRRRILQKWTEEDLKGRLEECQELARPAEVIFAEELKKRYSYVRQFSVPLLEAFRLQGVGGKGPLLQAADYLRDCNEKGWDETAAPLDFVPAAWKPYVCPRTDEVDRALWEICLLDRLRMGLKGGNVHVAHKGMHSSSDARMYGVPVRALNASFNPKYFASAGRGIGLYTHVSDLWIPFYTQVISCQVRQAPYVLDGLLYHGTHLEPQQHSTDTHGFTELIFAVCHLLGFRRDLR